MAAEIKTKETELGAIMAKMNHYNQKCNALEARIATAKKNVEAEKKSKGDSPGLLAIQKVEELKRSVQAAEAQKVMLEYRLRTAKNAIEASTKKLSSIMVDDTSMMQALSL